MTIDADVIVVGLGVGGEFVAGRLAEAGLDVVGIEPALVGGECPYWGCVPSKMIIRAANTLAEARRAGKLAGHATVEPDWSIVAQRIREEATDDWDDTVGVELAQAFARFGTAVTIVEAADRLLPAEEPQAGELIGEVLRREGIRVLSRTRLRRVSHDGRDFTVHLDGVGASTHVAMYQARIAASDVLGRHTSRPATGRCPA